MKSSDYRYTMEDLGMSAAEIELMILGISYGNNQIFNNLDEEILAIAIGISDNVTTNGFIVQHYIDDVKLLLLNKKAERMRGGHS